MGFKCQIQTREPRLLRLCFHLRRVLFPAQPVLTHVRWKIQSCTSLNASYFAAHVFLCTYSEYVNLAISNFAHLEDATADDTDTI